MTSDNKLTPQDREKAIDALTALKQLPDNAGHRGVINDAIELNTYEIEKAAAKAAADNQLKQDFARHDALEPINTALTEYLEANPVSIPIIRTF